MDTILTFPGLGIGEFTINPTAFTIPILGGIPVAWYGIIIVTGMILGFAYCAYRSRQEGFTLDELTDVAIFTIIAAVAGARAYYVISEYNSYFPIKSWSDFGDLFAINQGGMGIYGGLIAGAAMILIIAKVKKWSMTKLLKFFDSLAPAVFIGQIIGRWGNFCNGEAFGAELAQGNPLYFLRMGVASNASYGIFGDTAMHFVHPTFLYESVWNLIGFLIIHFTYKKKKVDGQLLLTYLAWYGFGRMFIEYLRMDSLPLIPGTEATGFNRLSLVVGFICFTVGTVLLIYFFIDSAKSLKSGTYAAPVFLTEEEAKANWAPKKVTEEAAEETDTAEASEEEAPFDEADDEEYDEELDEELDAQTDDGLEEELEDEADYEEENSSAGEDEDGKDN